MLLRVSVERLSYFSFQLTLLLVHKSIVKRRHTLSDISIENIVISTRDPAEFFTGRSLKEAHAPGDHPKAARIGFFVNQTAAGKKIVHRDPVVSPRFIHSKKNEY